MSRWSNAQTTQLTALVEGDIHECIKHRPEGAAVPAYFTLCRIRVPDGHVERGHARISCPKCLQIAESHSSPK